MYAQLAVPLIEPVAQGPTRPLDIEPGPKPTKRLSDEFRVWFKQGAWERSDPIMLEIAQGRLLLQDYTIPQSGDKRLVKIWPCTMILLPKERSADDDAWIRQAVILEAPAGADLEFDEPIDLARGSIGNLVAGRLKGRITIRSDYKSPGPQDDLLVLVQDAVLDKELITSVHPVEFRLGENHGSGQGLRIELSPKAEKIPRENKGPSFGGIRSLELERDVQMYLKIEESDVAAGRPSRPGRADNAPQERSPATPSEPSDGTQLTIQCRGPFRFDLEQRVATFEDHVDVVRANANGSADTLRGQWVAVYFSAAEQSDEDSAARADAKITDQALGKLEPTSLEVRGSPVIVSSPESDVEARGELLTYDLRTGQMSLKGREVWLRRGSDEIRAPEVHFKPGKEGGWTTFSATGPGRLRAALPDEPDVLLKAAWNERIHFGPHKGQPVLTLLGSAFVEIEGRGELRAERIYLWLREQQTSDSADRTSESGLSSQQLEPDRLLASGGVSFRLAQLVGNVDELQAWFKPQAAGGLDVATAGPGIPTQGSYAIPSARAAQVPGSGTGRAAPRGPDLRGAPGDGRHGGQRMVSDLRTGPAPLGPSAAEPSSEFHIDARLMQVELTLAEKSADVSGLILVDRVHVIEKQLVLSDRQPLELSGDRVEMQGSTAGGRQEITLTGRPAHIEAVSMALEGGHIFVNRAENNVHVEGPGTMSLPVDRDFEGRPIERPLPLTVRWQRQMDFDGRTARFRQQVETRLDQRILRTDAMDVTFSQVIDMANPPEDAADQRPEVENIACYGTVYLEGSTFEEGRRVSVERLWTRDLSIHQPSGKINGYGPGWLTRVSLGSSSAQLVPTTSDPRRTPRPQARPGEPQESEFTYLGIHFDDGLEGNLHRKQITFHQDVKAIYGPVAGWDGTIELEAFDHRDIEGVLLRCEQLSVREMDISPQRGFELEATGGDPTIEGRDFYARAGRMRYDQVKDSLVLEGLGRTKAELWHEEMVGAARSHWVARQIRYWRQTGQVAVDDAERMDLNLLSVDAPQ